MVGKMAPVGNGPTGIGGWSGGAVSLQDAASGRPSSSRGAPRRSSAVAVRDLVRLQVNAALEMEAASVLHAELGVSPPVP